MKEVYYPEVALFAAGCFWGVQHYFDQVPGVLETEVGYAGGHKANPSYEEVCTGRTGHSEVVKVTYRPEKVNFETLLLHFFRMHDPTQLNRQGPDIGTQYRSAIYCSSPAQREVARNVKALLQKKTSRQIVTEIRPLPEFYTAEDYHQKFTERTGRGICHVSYAPLKVLH